MNEPRMPGIVSWLPFRYVGRISVHIGRIFLRNFVRIYFRR